MTAQNPLRGRAVVLDRPNIDTDQIMPKQFTLRTDRHGYGDAVFYEWRRGGDSPLDLPRATGARFLVTGANFGCGSSREHAVWGLQDFGFGAVVAPSFADTFRSNAGASGLVTAQVSWATAASLTSALAADEETELELDVSAQTLRWGADLHSVTIPAFARHLWLNGQTEIGMALAHLPDITAYERGRPRWLPRVAATHPTP